MPSEIERAARAWRRRLLERERMAQAQMQRVYRQVWERLHAEIGRYTARIEAGDPLRPGLLYRREAAADAQEFIRQEILQYLRQVESSTVETQRYATASAYASVEEMVALQSPGVDVYLRRPNLRAVEAMVGYASDGSPLREVLESASLGQAEEMTELLARNVALGINPRVTARQMRQMFETTRVRSEAIARTETLRAYRSASLMTMQANADVLDGWIRHEACDSRTCVACWALHGRFYRLDEEPNEHINGRMTLIPKVKGRDRPIVSGEERFAELSAAEQRAVLGPAAYEAYSDGALRLGEMVGRRRSERWGDSVYVRSLRSVVGAERAAGYSRYVQIVAHNSALANLGETDRKWLLAGLGARAITEAELPAMLKYVAGRGFDDAVVSKGKYKGLSQAERHYSRHANEWSELITYTDYLDAARRVVERPGGVFAHTYRGEWQVGFVDDLEGPRQTLVQYRLAIGRWTTALRPSSGIDEYLKDASFGDVRWLKR